MNGYFQHYSISPGGRFEPDSAIEQEGAFSKGLIMDITFPKKSFRSNINLSPVFPKSLIEIKDRVYYGFGFHEYRNIGLESLILVDIPLLFFLLSFSSLYHSLNFFNPSCPSTSSRSK
jgi:hypothetical protein